MLPRALKGVVILVLGGLFAILLGKLIGEGDYESLLLLCYLCLGIFLLTTPGYVPLLALGLLNPFVLPIPFVYSFPFLAVMFGVCAIKLIFRDTLTHTEFRNYRSCLTLWIAVFFGWVIMRYLMKPVLPNVSGFGAHITGFRAYLYYALSFGVVVTLPLFIKTREDVLKLTRWIGILSVVFILLLVPLSFTKNLTAAVWLQRLGLFVTFFDNGWLRFVVLPCFGLSLLALAFCPGAAPMSKNMRRAAVALGAVAILMGGSRSGVVMAMVLVLMTYLLKAQFVRFYAVVLTMGLLLLIGTYLSETGRIKSDFAFMRILALTSNRAARQSDAGATWEWRKIRWERAMFEIKKNPILGQGYGGLENAWLFSTSEQYEKAGVEIDLAAGGVHNGFLSGAHALGIPAVLIFLIAFFHVIYRSWRTVYAVRKSDPVLADLQQFAIINALPFLPAVLIGTDLNSPTIWFYLALGAWLTRFKPEESKTAPRSASTEGALSLSIAR